MNEAAGAAAGPGAPTAGRLLREARERQGLHIAALAASIKVAPKKLEMLEADRFDALPDVTFTRALAQTVCRALKIDATVILSLLPPPVGHRLEQVGTGLNAPFRERPGALVQREGTGLTLGPVFWGTALILIAAVGVFFIPSGTIRMPQWATRGAPAASEPGTVRTDVPTTGGAAAASAVLPTGPDGQASQSLMSVPAELVPAASGEASGAAAVSLLQLRASQPSWIEVTDARGKSLVSRLVQPGEAVGVDGVPPLRLHIGNAAGTEVSFRGQPMELVAYTRDNVARLELK